MKKKRNENRLNVNELTQQALEYHRALLDEQEYTQLLKELDQPLYSAIRINPLKTKADAVNTWAQTYGWTLQAVPFCPTGWWVKESQTAPGQTIEHRLGSYYIQDAASMLPVELFDFEAGSSPLILDMAASPGGKTTHLISRSADQGLVIANDSSLDRITALRLILQTWGAVHTAVTNFPGEKFGGWFPETFDRILLDAPCSMQNLRSTESHPMRPISDKERLTLSQRQTRLLTSAIQALKTGGQVVYATCTLAPEEDEAVLDNILSIFGNAVEIKNLKSKLPSPAPGLLSDGSRQFNPAVQQAARLYPHRFATSGFFCALISKTAPVQGPEYEIPLRPLEKIGLKRLHPHDCENLNTLLLTAYGYDLNRFIQAENVNLWQRQEQVYILPERWIQHFGAIPFQAVGMLLGEYSNEGFVPAHEWISRFGAQFKNGFITLDAAQVTAWLRGEDIQGVFPIPDLPARTAVVFDENQRLLGRGKVFNGRIKNLLPRRIVF
ncbi:MAG: hypothetical protein LWX83_12185 [Anaerolineae bacterium]|nr:hypothetical protein [Anaerolineae bacterium]